MLQIQISMIEILYYYNIFSCFSMGMTLLLLKTAPRLTDKHYRTGKVFLAVATIILALGNAEILWQGIADSVEMFSIPVLVISQLQAALFTFLIFTLFHSPYVNRRNILRHLTPTIVFTVAYVATVIVCPDVELHSISQYLDNITNPGVILRTLFAAVYLVQIAIYIRLYRRERKCYIAKIDNYFSDTDKYKLGWASRLFYQGGGLGVLALAFCVVPNEAFDIVLTIIITYLYFNFTIQYINYQYRLFYALPAVSHTETPAAELAKETMNDKALDEAMNSLTLFRQQGIVLADYAQALNLSERKLSSYINSAYGVSFKRWVNGRRVEYAKELIAEYPHMTMDVIAEKAGFADKSHLSRISREFTGVPFAEHKKTPKNI